MGEALGAAIEFGSTLFASGGGEAAAGLGEAAAASSAAGAGGIADLVGTGTALFGGETGLAGTALAGGAATGADLGALAAGTTGLGALGTAADFIGAGGASAGGAGFGAAADTAAAEAAQTGLASGTGAINSNPASLASLTGAQPLATGGVTSSSQLSPNVANANASGSVFDTGANPVSSINAAGQPSVNPAGASASTVSAPGGVSAVADPTAAVQGATQAAGGAAGTGGAGSSISDLLTKAGSGALKSLTDNPLGVALGAGGLGYNILAGQKQTANQKALAADAATATANSTRLEQSGEALQQYLSSGQLPPAYQQQVDNAIKDAKTTAISNAAQQGLSTDPTQNTALAATLARIDASRSDMQAKVAQTLFSSGSSLVAAGQSAAGLSGQLYQALVANDTAAAKNTGQAIATLAAALNGKASNTIGKTNINVSQAA